MSGIKHDSGKPRLGLLPSQPLKEIAAVLTFGATKYEAHNWRKGFKWSRLVDASLRHLTAWNEGEDKDPESGLSHLAHAACCLLFLLEHEAKQLGEDDRFKAYAEQWVESPGAFVTTPEMPQTAFDVYNSFKGRVPPENPVKELREKHHSRKEANKPSEELIEAFSKEDSPGGRAAKSKCP